MPRALDPTARFPIVLKSDQSQPQPRPTFWARYLTGREWIELSNNAGQDALESWYNALRLAIVHWENVRDHNGDPIPYAPATFENILDPGEARELVLACIAGQQPNADEKKGSASPSPSRLANSAPPAGQGAATNTPARPAAGRGSNVQNATPPAAPPATAEVGLS